MPDDSFMSAKEIGKRLNINRKTVPHLASEHNLTVKKLSYHDRLYNINEIRQSLCGAQPNGHNERFLEASATKKYDDYWKLDWSEFIVCCDAHSPYIHEEMFNRMIQVGQKYKIKNIVHAGDFWDQQQFSYFDVDPEDMTDWAYDVAYSKKIAKILTDTFDDVRFFLGSHDIRFYRMMLQQGKAQKIDGVWGLLENPKVQVSKYRYCEVGDEWRINHPKNIVRVGGLPAVRMSAKHERSVIFAHGHWYGQVMDPSGKHYLIAPGCLVDQNKVAYASVWDTSYDKWIPGFVMVVERNKPILFNENSPWGIYLPNH